MDQAVDVYLRAIPPERAERVARRDESIVELSPEAGLEMGCGVASYRAENGWTALADQNQ